jgi:hypothetical protein
MDMNFYLSSSKKVIDWEFYLDTYPDLRQNGIHTEQQALQHWNTYGQKEGRESVRNISIQICSSIKNKTPILFTKYGDGEYLCAISTVGNNCDGDNYTPNKKDKLIESFKYIYKVNNSYIGLWTDITIKKYWESLVNPIKWCDYHSIIIHDNNIQKVQIYKEIKYSTMKKIYVCNSSLNSVKDILNIDIIINIPDNNWFEQYEYIFKEIKNHISEQCIVMTSAGMASKILISDLHKLFPMNIYLDFGSAMDKICTKKETRAGQMEYEKLKEILKEILPNDLDWKFYLDTYPDLRQNGIHTEQQALQHWNTYGQKEGRIPFFYFDWKFYLDIYPDLRQNGIHTEQQALQHWNKYGKQEGRECKINDLFLNKKNYTIDDFNNYMKKYDTLNTILVYDFNTKDGGIGDCIKFFIISLLFCIENNIKLKYQINNIILEQYLKLKYEKFYIKNHNYNRIKPFLFYKFFSYDDIQMPLQELFYFTEKVKENAYHLLPLDDYISIHLRLGDKYLETDRSFVLVTNDERKYDELKVYAYIESNLDKKLVFFCDNQSYKQKIKAKYSIFTTNASIGHTGLTNTLDNQVLDAISEFYLICHSKKIISISYSGFSTMASKYKNIPILYI